MKTMPHPHASEAAETCHQIHAALTGCAQSVATRAPVTQAPAVPAAPTEPLLLQMDGAAALLGMSRRQFIRMRPNLPAPVVLGPRHVRWRRVDLAKWVAELEGVDEHQEPAQLKSSRIARKGTPGALVADRGSPAQNSNGTRSSRQNLAPSNPGNTAVEGAQ